jgi:glucosylglycerate synthase
LAEDIFLGDDFLRQLMSVGEVDLLVAVPSYNNAGTIGQTVQAIEESYQQNFVRDRVVIVNVDGGSTDHTPDVVLNMNGRKSGGHRGITSLRTVHRVATQYAKSPSLGMALRTILATADLLRARSCAVVSPSTTNLDASWIANLLRPAYRQEFEFVAPLYARSKYQGLLARNVLYPMSRAVFGQGIREMYSEEWGFSGHLAAQCLAQNVWNDEGIRVRPEAWMAITAISSDLKCCQSFLGPKAPPAAGTGPDLVEAIRQTVGNLFWCLEVFHEYWPERKRSQPVPSFGPEHELVADDKPPNRERIFERFQSGVTELGSILSSILTADTYARIKQIAALDPDKFRFGPELWVRTLYEFAASYHHDVINRDHLVQALVSLYRGQSYSFLLEHANSSAEEIEADSEILCLEFENQKPYLIERWKAKS